MRNNTEESFLSFLVAPIHHGQDTADKINVKKSLFLLAKTNKQTKTKTNLWRLGRTRDEGGPSGFPENVSNPRALFRPRTGISKWIRFSV